MPVTLTDVAKAAQVSRQVVSAVLAEGKHVGVRFSEDTREKVLAAVELVGYRRNRQAAQMRSGRQGAIALLSSNLNTLPHNTLEWMVRHASERNLLLVIERLHVDSDDWAPRLLHEHYADGVIVFETLTTAQRQQLAHLSLPVVEVHSAHSKGPGCIVYDIEDAVTRAVDRFQKSGHQRLGFIGPIKPEHFSAEVRYESLCRQARQRHLAKPVHAGPDDIATAIATCDAILLNNDHLAPAVYRAARAAGRHIGVDLSVIGFDNAAIAGLLDPPLPSFRMVASQLAAIVIAHIEREIADPGSTSPITVPYQLERAE
jgi:LacI family transcriptional regulator, repressor for deo operon, udp, cdd, tsx, nupC, and nupG